METNLNVVGAGPQVMSSVPEQKELQRVLTTRDLVIFGMVFMSPVAAQILYGSLVQGSQGHAVLAYLFGLVAMIFTAYSYGKMASAYPSAGSTYAYTAKAIHPYLGFLSGWAILLDYMLIPMILYKTGALFMGELIPGIPMWAMLLLFVLPVTVINYYGSQLSSRFNFWMMIVMLASIVLFVGYAIVALSNGVGVGQVFALQGIYNEMTFSWDALIAGTSIAVLSYLGFDAVTTMAEDSSVTGKTIGRAAVLSCVATTLVFIPQVYFAILVIPDFNSFQSPDTAFFEVATAVGGPFLATIVTLVIAISGISTALAGQASASRVLFGMGRDRVLPGFLAILHPKHKTPMYAILVMGVLGYIGSILIDLNTLFLITVFGALVGFICVNLSVFTEYFIKRKERTGMGLITNLLFPLIGLIVCGYILYGMDTIGKMVGIGWLVIGALFLAATTGGFKRLPGKFDL
ncbi:APC family permease [Brevibacillus dissolubilis]|uniref:APC family permease n=1 Tax=Brevibacillus dissolubilis TaxID=1844116 RepID=UPI0021000745|nr:APC family permease [Brevibacillus dissolubilis]